MQNTSPSATMPKGLWSPLSAKAFFLIVLVLATCLISFDIVLNGPLTYSTAQILVVSAVEKKWGFHAEDKEYVHGDHSHWLLTVVQVTAGGAFERAGIRPGFAFAPRRSATGGPWFGGMYSIFLSGREGVRVRILRNPGDSWEEHTFEVVHE